MKRYTMGSLESVWRETSCFVLRAWLLFLENKEGISYWNETTHHGTTHHSQLATGQLTVEQFNNPIELFKSNLKSILIFCCSHFIWYLLLHPFFNDSIPLFL
uniref:Uncharacterized protein n=1 Tax=Micrurus lemniscatus lemniscatus TaxID=129467 RepID=A0A2D4IFZ8_MICLE